MIHNNQPLLLASYFETSATALCGTTGMTAYIIMLIFCVIQVLLGYSSHQAWFLFGAVLTHIAHQLLSLGYPTFSFDGWIAVWCASVISYVVNSCTLMLFQNPQSILEIWNIGMSERQSQNGQNNLAKNSGQFERWQAWQASCRKGLTGPTGGNKVFPKHPQTCGKLEIWKFPKLVETRSRKGQGLWKASCH